jgi:hypothetical protein
MSKSKLAGGFALPAPPKRTEVPETKATRFESPKKAANGEGTSKLRRPSLGERLAVYVPPELASELRVTCARERRSISDAVTEAVSIWIQSHRATGT